MEQLILLLIIGAISLINWLMQRSAELREKKKLERARDRGEEASSPAPEATGRNVPSEDPAESMRKLMEALGLPVEEPPPPRRAPQQEFQPEREREVVFEETFQPPEPPPLPQATVFERPQAPLRPQPALPVYSAPKPSPRRKETPVESPAQPSRFRELLASPSGMRDAVILSEILQPPPGLSGPRM